MDTQQKGNVAESKAITRLQQEGYTVYLPFGESSGADLIADMGGDLKRIQVKSSRMESGSIVAELSRTNMKSGGANRSYYTEDEVDIFIVYSPEMDEVYLVNYEDAAKTRITLRVSEPDNPHPSIRWASEYRL